MSKDKLTSRSETLYTLGASLEDQFEAARDELRRAEGAVRSFSDFSKKMDNWVQEVRNSLIQEVSQEKMSVDAANIAIGWVGKTRDFFVQNFEETKIFYGVRRGELTAKEDVLKQVKTQYENVTREISEIAAKEVEASKVVAAQEVRSQDSVAPTKAAVPPPAEAPKSKKTKKHPEVDESHPMHSRMKDIKARRGRRPAAPALNEK